MNVIRLRLRGLAAATVTALASAACGSGGSTPVAPIPRATPSLAATPVAGATSAVSYGAQLLAGATPQKRATLRSVGATLVMTMRDAAGLVAYAKAANDPKNALFRHWLTPQQLGDRYGASAADYATAATSLAASGISVKTYPQRQTLRILGPQGAVERALGVQFEVYTKNGRSFVAPLAAPRPAAALHVAALTNVVHVAVRSRRFLPVRAASSLLQGYAPQQIANGFDYTGAYAAGYKGDGITIGIIGTGPITDGDPRLGGGDVTDFRTLFGVGGNGSVTQDVDTMNVSPGNAGGPPGEQYSPGLATPPPVTNPGAPGCTAQKYSPGDPFPAAGSSFDFTTCNPEDFEAQLDTEQAAALAPDAAVNFYIAYNPDECFGNCADTTNPHQTNGVGDQEEGIALSDDEIQQAIADNKSDVLSISFGASETNSRELGYFGQGTDPTQGYGPVELASLAAMGTAIFASSGDNGAEECSDVGESDVPCVVYPATDPSVMAVGGVNAPFDPSGRLTGPLTGWGVATQITGASIPPGGSGGGCSTVFAKPSYEAGLSECGTLRTQPDLALDADTNTGVAAVIDAPPGLGGRSIVAIGGTSVATPQMAAMWALVLQACKQNATCTAHGGTGPTAYRLGNPGPYLYAIYASRAQYAAAFADVLYGNNALPNSAGALDPGFTAGTGYDQVTGIGVPYGRNLITAVLANVP